MHELIREDDSTWSAHPGVDIGTAITTRRPFRATLAWLQGWVVTVIVDTVVVGAVVVGAVVAGVGA